MNEPPYIASGCIDIVNNGTLEDKGDKEELAKKHSLYTSPMLQDLILLDKKTVGRNFYLVYV